MQEQDEILINTIFSDKVKLITIRSTNLNWK